MSSFSVDIKALCNVAKSNMSAVVRQSVIGLGNNIIERTPVGDPTLWKHSAPPGYVGGAARANWQYGNLAGDGIPMSQLPDIDPSGQVSINRIRAGVESSEAATVHYIVNNLPYINALEFEHHSTQAPNGMVRLAIVEFQQTVDNAVASVK